MCWPGFRSCLDPSVHLPFSPSLHSLQMSSWLWIDLGSIAEKRQLKSSHQILGFLSLIMTNDTWISCLFEMGAHSTKMSLWWNIRVSGESCSLGWTPSVSWFLEGVWMGTQQAEEPGQFLPLPKKPLVIPWGSSKKRCCESLKLLTWT
jgi:hypothetical protein